MRAVAETIRPPLNPIPAALKHEDQCCVYQHLNPARPQLSHRMGAPTGVGIKMDRAVYLQWESKVEKQDVGSIDLVATRALVCALCA